MAREGSITRATKQLHLAQPTISGQLRSLERSLGEKLFRRVGRNLALTEAGEVVFGYAEEIFALGRQLVDAVHHRPSVRLMVGIHQSMPKLIAYRMLQPALASGSSIRLVCREDKLDRLLADLSVHGLDLVIADAPLKPTLKVKAYSHRLGECGVSLYAAKRLAASLEDAFPESLNGAPFLLPTDGAMLRRGLEAWFSEIDVSPTIVGEFDECALIRVFGEQGAGVFAVPDVLDDELGRRVSKLGSAGEVKETYYAISPERRLQHPAVVALSEGAKEMFE